jgi:hypothetical protein
MNSPLERRKVRLRGLGGLAVCGVPGDRASAAGTSPRIAPPAFAAPCTRGHNPRRRILRFSSGEFIRSWRGLGGLRVCRVPGACASAAGHPRIAPPAFAAPCTRGHNPRRRILRFSSGEFIRSWRGLGGLAVCGVPGACASAAGTSPRIAPLVFAAPRTRGHNPRRRILRFSSGEFIRSWSGLGGPAECGVSRTGASAAGGSYRPRTSVIPKERTTGTFLHPNACARLRNLPSAMGGGPPSRRGGGRFGGLPRTRGSGGGLPRLPSRSPTVDSSALQRVARGEVRRGRASE